MAITKRYSGPGKVFEGDRELANVDYALTESREVRDGIPRYSAISGFITVTDHRMLPDRDWPLTLILEDGSRGDFILENSPSPLDKGPYKIKVTSGFLPAK